MKRVAFLDRDGVINKLIVRPGSKAVAPWTFEEFEYLPKAVEAVGILKSLGYITHITTNQPDVADGLMTWTALGQMIDKIKEDMAIDDLSMAHDRKHAWYKPRPGMLIDGMAKHGADPADCWMIGDSYKDVGAGLAAGVKTIWISDKPWVDVVDDVTGLIVGKPHYQCSSLHEAAMMMKGLSNG